MSGFKFSPPSLVGLPIQPLGELPLPEIVSAEAVYDGNPTLGEITFSFDASAKGAILVCNDEGDEEEDDGVLGPADADETDDARSPALTFSPEHAWLKYRFEGSAQGAATAEFAPGGVAIKPKVEARKGVVFAYYRRHGPEEIAAEAVVRDAVSLRAAFDADDALALEEGDALLYRVYGRLSVGLTLKWSDVFTASLRRLSDLLPQGSGLLAIKADAGAEVSFNVGVRDDFRLVFTKGGPVGEIAETVRVSVFKSKAREVGLKADLGVTVEFADPQAVERQLASVYEALAGPLVGNVDKLLEQFDRFTTFQDLPAELQMAANLLMIRLGLNPQLNKLNELRLKWEELKGKVPGIIEQVAQTKVALTFTYEYLRVSTDQTLLRADLDPETFRRFHPDLMVCRLKGLTEWLRDEAPADALKRYLRRKALKVSKAWGFGLGISPWGVKVGGTDRLETTRVIQENVEGAQRIAYDGMRGYEALWMDDKVTFAADFKADMSEFKLPPLTCHFDYGLSFKWEWEEKSLGREEFMKMLDHARLWSLVKPTRADEEVLREVESGFGSPANVRMELTLDKGALVEVLPLLLDPPAPPFNTPKGYEEFDAKAKLKTWGAESLAAAMPYMKMFAARRDPTTRQHLYAPLWRRYFKEPSLSFSDYRQIARDNIPNLVDQLKLNLDNKQGLAAHEFVEAQKRSTFAGMIELQKGPGESASGIHDNWLRFARGLGTLEAASRPGNCEPYKLIEQSFDDLSSFFTQSLYLRAVGFYIGEVGRLTGKSRHLKRTFAVTYGDEETIAVGS